MLRVKFWWFLNKRFRIKVMIITKGKKIPLWKIHFKNLQNHANSREKYRRKLELIRLTQQLKLLLTHKKLGPIQNKFPHLQHPGLVVIVLPLLLIYLILEKNNLRWSLKYIVNYPNSHYYNTNCYILADLHYYRSK